jgi:hypothetical protein
MTSTMMALTCKTTPNQNKGGHRRDNPHTYILSTHPIVRECSKEPPNHTLMVEISQSLHDYIVSKLGDGDIKATDFTSKGSKTLPRCTIHVVYNQR